LSPSSRPVRSRLVARVAALVLVGVVAAACGGDVPRGAAATVDGVEIPREQLAGWVRAALNDNPALDEAAVQRDLLSRAIQARIIGGVLEARGLVVTEEDLAAVRAQILDEVGGEETLATTLTEIGFPLDFYETVFVANEAAIDVLVRDLAKDRVLETRTARHILLDTAEEADEVFALLADGADFAELALERSQDPGSAIEGGSLGARERGVFVPEFDEAVWSARLDVVLEPVESQFGFHVIEVVAADRRTADQLDPNALRQLVNRELGDVIGAAVASTQVLVAANLGTWDAVNGSVVAAAAGGTARG
jgi:parvulin-like peptidyl-prolyl isomerase